MGEKIVMSRAQFEEKYGQCAVKFSSYYKYVFTFKAELPNGDMLYVSVGGDSSDIYRFTVTADEASVVGCMDISYASICRNGVEVECFNDW